MQHPPETQLHLLKYLYQLEPRAAVEGQDPLSFRDYRQSLGDRTPRERGEEDEWGYDGEREREGENDC